MSTVTKLGAYGLAVVAAFAVAFAVLVTAPRSSVVAQTAPTPDAIIAATDGDLGAATATPTKKAGSKALIAVTTDGDTDGHTFIFAIAADSNAEATFTHDSASSNDKRLLCSDAATVTSATCDRSSTENQVLVEIQISAEAANGRLVLVDVTSVNQPTVAKSRVVITVEKAATPTKFTAKVKTGWPTTISASPDTLLELARVGNASDARTRGVTAIDIDLHDKDGNDVAQALTITTTNALVLAEQGLPATCGSRVGGQDSTGVALCDARNFDGEGTIYVWGSGLPGVSTVTLTTGSFTETVEITLYGDAKTITAEAEQSSVQRGGSVFIVATVVDGADNPVQGHIVADGTGSTDGVKAPEVDNAVAVETSASVMKDVDGTANDLPACDQGTNAKGKCVIQVTAPNPATASQKATLGKHTVTVVGSSPILAADRKVKVDITVAGAVDSITTDAPARVEPGSRTEIEVTIRDADGVLAGAQGVTVTLVAGNGRVIGGEQAKTTNGARKFTYRAANDAGTAEFDIEVRGLNTAGELVASGKVLKTESISIEVGGEPAPEPPAQPTAAGITSDAPDRVDPGTSTDITVTVTDADGERAGMQSVTATQISGDGRVINGGPAATENGRYTFTFRAARTVGVAEIDVDVRSLVNGAATTTGRVLATLSLTIQVGEPPAPAATLDPAPSGSGVAITTFSGGTVSELQSLLLDTCSSGSVAAYATVRGGFVPFIPGSRIAAVNAAFMSAVVTDGMVPRTGLLVSGCD